MAKNSKTIISGPEAVRVRFAPSPTGYLHIGSARTAFFNWLFAKKTKGKFILRIEDTDMSRHMEEPIDLIMDSLKWLGINWDEGPDTGGNFGPYRQSQRKDIYSSYAGKMIADGNAYYCFCSQEKLAEKRQSFIEGRGSDYYEYDRECYYLAKDKIEQNLKEGIPYTVRLLVPDDYDIAFTDTVYGPISVNSGTQEDFIIIRSNGLPTYNFSAAVDDILMEITHVIRGEDHLSNTPKQILIYKALDEELPVFTHLPMIHGADGQKLSKRHGSISIEAYRDEGFLPEALRNYLALLGWAFDEKTTVFSSNDLINKFSLKDINKKPAKFDYEKLLWLNGYYIRQMPEKELEKLLAKRVTSADISIKGKNITDKNIAAVLPAIKKIIPLIKERVKTLKEARDITVKFFEDINYENDFIEYIKSNKERALGITEDALSLLKNIDDFSHQGIEAALRSISEKRNIGFRKVAEIIRAAIWGARVSPPMFGTMEILGKDTCIARLDSFMDMLS